VTWLLGAGYRSFSYDLDLDNGYFDPQDYSTYFALLGARGPFGSTSATWDLATEVGRQSFTLAGVDTEDDQTLNGVFHVRLPDGQVGDARGLLCAQRLGDSDRYGLPKATNTALVCAFRGAGDGRARRPMRIAALVSAMESSRPAAQAEESCRIGS